MMDTVKLTLPGTHCLPIVFIPGIMGSNLSNLEGSPVWLLNTTGGEAMGLATEWATKDAAHRQRVLHPDRTRVFKHGNVPYLGVGTAKNSKSYLDRGWGEVAEGSYHEFLTWLEERMNGPVGMAGSVEAFSVAKNSVRTSKKSGVGNLAPGLRMKMAGLPPTSDFGEVTTDVLSQELTQRGLFRFPVYAMGYNWLQSNSIAAAQLSKRIRLIIAENNIHTQKCEQVILVTHSMGGLVARACCEISGMKEFIAGIVHGVMPAVGASVAYRRCKAGMSEESFVAGEVIGADGQQVTAVFSQAPGALQLLPSEDYKKGWLNVSADGVTPLELPKLDPYEEIYLKRDQWWGLVNEDWLKPQGGLSIDWDVYRSNVLTARAFHRGLSKKYHPNTYVFYGGGTGSKEKSFETVRWRVARGRRPSENGMPASKDVFEMPHKNVHEPGGNTVFIGQKMLRPVNFGTSRENSNAMPEMQSFWEARVLLQDGRGDGTVSASSGGAPKKTNPQEVRQQFNLGGFGHEKAYKYEEPRCVTEYAITKIAGMAKR
ncbi:esterase/lipase family protein [Pseudoduganella buxea]|nr:hypothetical protein [Pseudoduganella buxea]